MSIVNPLTVDMEDYFHVAALAPNIHRDSSTTRESRVVENTQKLLTIFEQIDVRATLFVLRWVAQQYPRLVKDVAARGYEIACYGLSNRCVYEQSQEEFHDETRRAKHLLEDIKGSAVLGNRAASYSIVRDSLWALDILVELGFACNSSIIPVRHDRYYGIPNAARLLHGISTPKGKSIVEWPLSTTRVFGFNIFVSGGRLFPALSVLADLLGIEFHQPPRSTPVYFLPAPMGGRSRAAARAGKSAVAVSSIQISPSSRKGYRSSSASSGSVLRETVSCNSVCFPTTEFVAGSIAQEEGPQID